MKTQAPDFRTILRVLAENRVEFIVIGGVCATLHGAPVTTFDLDIVHARGPANLSRLQAALGDLDAFYREKPDQRIRPRTSDLGGPGHHLLMTRAGPLDLLGTVVTGEGYDELKTQSIEFGVGGNLHVLALRLNRLIDLKEKLGRERDRAVLPILRRTQDERSGCHGNGT